MRLCDPFCYGKFPGYRNRVLLLILCISNFPFNFNVFQCSLVFVLQYQNIDLFYATGLFLYPLKTSENQRFSNVFRSYRKRPVACNGLKYIETKKDIVTKWVNPFSANLTKWSSKLK